MLEAEARLRCQHCICLVEGDNNEWRCDEVDLPITEVDECPEGLD